MNNTPPSAPAEGALPKASRSGRATLTIHLAELTCMRPQWHTSVTYEFATPDALTFIGEERTGARIVPNYDQESTSSIGDARTLLFV